uniref:Uncharacterized protein n=2 Tax=viral metagenome TaxID=1070528 RepID=A0A6M3K6D8_9ZZZZ
MADKNGQGGPADGQGVKVGDKVYTADDVNNLLSQAEAATKKSQVYSKFEDYVNRYGLEPDEFLDQVDGSFSVVSNLLKEGVIDEKGNIVEKKKPDTKKPEGEPGGDDLSKLLSGDTSGLKGEEKIAAIVAKATAGIKDEFSKQVKDLADVQTSMIRSSYEDKLRTKYPHFKTDDVHRVFALAMNDKRKSFWEHAEMVAEDRKGQMTELEKQFAEKYGIDLEKFNENKLKEQAGKGGGSMLIPEGKKISFRGNRDKDKTVEPVELTREFFKQNA